MVIKEFAKRMYAYVHSLIEIQYNQGRIARLLQLGGGGEVVHQPNFRIHTVNFRIFAVKSIGKASSSEAANQENTEAMLPRENFGLLGLGNAIFCLLR